MLFPTSSAGSSVKSPSGYMCLACIVLNGGNIARTVQVTQTSKHEFASNREQPSG